MQIHDVRADTKRTWTSRLDSSIKRVMLQNRRAAQELQLHMDESALLQKENKILMEERTKLLHVRDPVL